LSGADVETLLVIVSAPHFARHEKVRRSRKERIKSGEISRCCSQRQALSLV